ncbi:TetR/AcrR family transcriptional regulator [Herbiconiux sp. CPCC 205763]|uniref:TetR/AcrR family transcriptional regulator n=1 Tax=Herbiconiux aconitum TaxID=2970913 RepID=A0ABT2GQ46_9MICO|nr:helix-turn-helix domain-containing protein [Herbiconiux aconitum]MCS5717707.1 TetR/AcrR family transcriptional regulator [Herbiconiux aconitum]
MERTLTAKGLATRKRIVEGAAVLMRAEGVARTSLDSVCASTGTGKSQLFHYFPAGKDALLVAVAEHEAASVLADQEPYLSELTSWDAWTKWRDILIARYAALGSRCPLGVLTTQLGPTSPTSERIANDLLVTWQNHIRTGIESMQSIGQIRQTIDAATASAALISGIYGGVVILLATGSTTHLQASLDMSIEDLKSL